MRFKTKLKPKFTWPWYVVIVAMIFPLFLYANNLGQAALSDLWRPVLFSVLAGIVILGALLLFVRDFEKAGLITVLVEMFVFSYGHIYNVLKPVTLFGMFIGRHRHLVPGLVILIGVLAWLILKRVKQSENLVKLVAVLSLFLFAFQVVRIAYFEISSAISQTKQKQWTNLEAVQTNEPRRDIYLIVLDSYMRSDVLKDTFGYDNSTFINQLEEYGFYVASCSRSNYAYTIQSMTSELNMAYLEDLGLPFRDQELSAKLQQSEIRKFLDAQGYEFVFFESGYPWIEMEDADRYIPARSMAKIRDFEFLYLKTTLMIFPYDINKKVGNDLIDASMQSYIDRTNNVLTHLQNPIISDAPLFVYAHIVSPHNPKLFTENGSINPDWDLDKIESAAGTYSYIDDQVLKAIAAILKNSHPDPIIILQADHGDRYEAEFRTLILNSYFLPGGGEEELYPTISPVNSFRVILNGYFGQNYPLLEDRSYFSPEKSRYDFELMEEPYDYCHDPNGD